MHPDPSGEMTAPSHEVKVAVVGGGRMGTGIAHACLLAGWDVQLVEVNPQVAAGCEHQITSLLQASRARGALLDYPEDVIRRLRVRVDMNGVDRVDLAIEAVPEDAGLKARVLSDLEERMAEDGVLASNTSSIPVGELACALMRPDRCLGLHFFNPVPASKLVEVIPGPETHPEVISKARRWIHALGKETVISHDSPGFASTRLGVLFGLEAVRMVEEGVASPEDIDRAMVLGYRHPIGPLHLADLVGLDVRLGIAKHLHQRLGERFAPPDLLQAKVAAGELGRKSGRGFFVYG